MATPPWWQHEPRGPLQQRAPAPALPWGAAWANAPGPAIASRPSSSFEQPGARGHSSPRGGPEPCTDRLLPVDPRPGSPDLEVRRTRGSKERGQNRCFDRDAGTLARGLCRRKLAAVLARSRWFPGRRSPPCSAERFAPALDPGQRSGTVDDAVFDAPCQNGDDRSDAPRSGARIHTTGVPGQRGRPPLVTTIAEPLLERASTGRRRSAAARASRSPPCRVRSFQPTLQP